MNESLPLGLYKKMQAIMATATHLEKDKVNEHFKYKYASEQAIKELFHPLLVQHGVLFVPTKVEILSQSPVIIKVEKRVNETGKSGGGLDASERGDSLTRIRYHYRFIDVDDGGFIEGFVDANGHDTLDKGCYKAMTGAIKYILTGTFLLPTGDDPEKASAADRKAAAQVDPQTLPREDQYTRLDAVLAICEQQGVITAKQRVVYCARGRAIKTADLLEEAIEKAGLLLGKAETNGNGSEPPENTQGE